MQSLTLPGVSSHKSGVVDGLVVPASGGDMELLQTPRSRRVLVREIQTNVIQYSSYQCYEPIRNLFGNFLNFTHVYLKECIIFIIYENVTSVGLLYLRLIYLRRY